MNLKDAFLFRFDWLELVDPEVGFYAEDMVSVQESDFESTPKTGTEFFNMVRNRCLWNLKDQSVSDLQYFKKKNRKMMIPPSYPT